MSLAQRAKTNLIRASLRIPVLDTIVLKQLDSRNPTAPWRLRHPYDVEHGVDTSGMVSGADLSSQIDTGYGAAQPSMMRQAFEQIPGRARLSFVDLGCGKGRPCLVATEYEFSEIVGVELAPALARIARRNAGVFRRRFPNRKGIDIVTGDALAYRLPANGLVVFLYNPFGEAQVTRLVDNLVSMLPGRSEDVFVIYFHPVWAAAFDASPAFRRHYASQMPYASEELGFGPDRSDEVVIWQARTHN